MTGSSTPADTSINTSIAPVNATPLPQSLTGARVLVIGGSSGIGLAAADLLAGVNAVAILAARDGGRLASAARAISDAHGGPIRTEEVDVVDSASVEALFARVGPLDHVFVPASGFAAGPISTIAAPERDANILGRVIGGHHIARWAAPRLPAGGSITYTSGIFVTRPSAGVALGAASLGAIEAYTRALALELAPLRVNAVRPGQTDTPFLRDLIGADRGPAGDSAVAGVGAAIPLGRVATAAEVAAAALFLMANSFITGTVITVDGGGSLG
jgi:NAD(P)-dependent dehydrogenase (short-subunit alcohol dehydrogenase family)